jgi:hypothetical protein
MPCHDKSCSLAGQEGYEEKVLVVSVLTSVAFVQYSTG